MIGISEEMGRQMRRERNKTMTSSLMLFMLIEIVLFIWSLVGTFDERASTLAYKVFYLLWLMNMLGAFTFFWFFYGEYANLAIYRLGIRTTHIGGYFGILYFFGFKVIPAVTIVFCAIEHVYLVFGVCTQNLTYPGRWILISIRWISSRISFGNNESLGRTPVVVNTISGSDSLGSFNYSDNWRESSLGSESLDTVEDDSEFFDDSDYVHDVSTSSTSEAESETSEWDN